MLGHELEEFSFVDLDQIRPWVKFVWACYLNRPRSYRDSETVRERNGKIRWYQNVDENELIGKLSVNLEFYVSAFSAF